MSASFDNAVSAGLGFGVTTLTTGAFTIGSGTNRAAQVHLTMGGNAATAITASLGGTSGSLVAGTDSGSTTTTDRTMIFSVIAPPSGSKTATASWTTAETADLGVITAAGVDQTTPCNNGTFSAGASSGSTSVALAVTSTSGDLAAACASVYQDALSSLSQTVKWGIDSTSTAGAIGPGTGSTTFTSVRPFTSDGFAMSGANFKQAAAVGGAVMPPPGSHRPAPFAPGSTTVSRGGF